jgi:hypothetical protein
MQQAYFIITTTNHERKAQKGPDVRKLAGTKKRNYSENRLRTSI